MVGRRQTRLAVHLFLTRIFIGILISSTGALEVFSAESETNRRYYFDQFTTGEGLFRKNIDCIIQDEEGFIYTCTQNGLYIFNGNSFKVLYQDSNPEISNKTFSAISIGSGKIIIGTVDKGLYIYDKRLEKIYHPELVLNDRLLNPSIRSLFEDQQGVIWAGCTSGRVLIIDKQDLLTAGDKTVIDCQTIRTGNSHAVNSICQWGDDVYIGTDGPTLYYIHADKSKQQAVRAKNLDQSCRQILSLHVNNNMLWLGEGPVLKFNCYDLTNEVSLPDLPISKSTPCRALYFLKRAKASPSKLLPARRKTSDRRGIDSPRCLQRGIIDPFICLFYCARQSRSKLR